MKQAWETAVAYKLVWVRVILLFTMPMISSYMASANNVDLDVKWATMGPHARIVFWLGVISPGLAILVAFLDQSLSRVKEEQDKKRSGDTQFLEKPPA